MCTESCGCNVVVITFSRAIMVNFNGRLEVNMSVLVSNELRNRVNKHVFTNVDYRDDTLNHLTASQNLDSDSLLRAVLGQMEAIFCLLIFETLHTPSIDVFTSELLIEFDDNLVFNMVETVRKGN